MREKERIHLLYHFTNQPKIKKNEIANKNLKFAIPVVVVIRIINKVND